MASLKTFVVSDALISKQTVENSLINSIYNYFNVDDLLETEYTGIANLKNILSETDILTDTIICIMFFRSGDKRFNDIILQNNLYFKRFLQKDKNNILIFTEPWEFFDYRNFIETYLKNTDPSQIKYLTSNIDLENSNIEIKKFMSFIPYTYSVCENGSKQQYNPDKDFFIPAFTVRGTKFVVMHLLKYADLLENNYYTYTGNDQDNIKTEILNFFKNSSKFKTLESSFSKNIDLFSVKIEEDISGNRYSYKHLNLELEKYYKSCRIGVVIEDFFLIGKNKNFVYHKLPNIITEKTWLFVYFKKPFLMFQAKHFLKNFRKLGFKTFSPFINEDYDDIDDDIERFQTCIDEMKRISLLSEKDKNILLDNLKEVCEYNFGLMSEMYNKKELIL